MGFEFHGPQSRGRFGSRSEMLRSLNGFGCWITGPSMCTSTSTSSRNRPRWLCTVNLAGGLVIAIRSRPTSSKAPRTSSSQSSTFARNSSSLRSSLMSRSRSELLNDGPVFVSHSGCTESDCRSDSSRLRTHVRLGSAGSLDGSCLRYRRRSASSNGSSTFGSHVYRRMSSGPRATVTSKSLWRANSRRINICMAR